MRRRLCILVFQNHSEVAKNPQAPTNKAVLDALLCTRDHLEYEEVYRLDSEGVG